MLGRRHVTACTFDFDARWRRILSFSYILKIRDPMDRRQDGPCSLCGPRWGSKRTGLSREWNYSPHSNQTVDLHALQLTPHSSVSSRPFWAMCEQPSSHVLAPVCSGMFRLSIEPIKSSIVGSHVHNPRQCWTACLCYLDVVYAKWLQTWVTETWYAVHPAHSRIICVYSFSKGSGHVEFSVIVTFLCSYDRGFITTPFLVY